RSQYYITRALFGTRSLFAMTEPQFSSAKDDDTPFKVNGDPSPLTDQRIPTEACECSVTGILITYTCSLTHLHRVYIHQVHNHPHLSQPSHIPHTPFTQVSGIAIQRINKPWISRDLTFLWITFAPVIVCTSYVYRFSFSFAYSISSCVVSTLPSVTRVLFAAAA